MSHGLRTVYFYTYSKGFTSQKPSAFPGLSNPSLPLASVPRFKH